MTLETITREMGLSPACAKKLKRLAAFFRHTDPDCAISFLDGMHRGVLGCPVVAVNVGGSEVLVSVSRDGTDEEVMVKSGLRFLTKESVEVLAL